jgi:Protein of unknown function (DUF760)
LTLQQSLGLDDSLSFDSDEFQLTGSSENRPNEKIDSLAGKVRGKIRVKYQIPAVTGSGDPIVDDSSSHHDESMSKGGVDIEVDAAAYMSELRSEVAKLRDELAVVQKKQEDKLNKDLLTYIRTLPPRELQSLTNTMSPDVLVAMQGLVNAVMVGIGGKDGEIIGHDTVTEQSAEAMAQLCMWQLVIGYNLRTLEVREEMRKSLTGSYATGDDYNNGGIDQYETGILE